MFNYRNTGQMPCLYSHGTVIGVSHFCVTLSEMPRQAQFSRPPALTNFVHMHVRFVEGQVLCVLLALFARHCCIADLPDKDNQLFYHIIFHRISLSSLPYATISLILSLLHHSNPSPLLPLFYNHSPIFQTY